MDRYSRIKTRTFSAYVIVMLIMMLIFSAGTTAYLTWAKWQEYLGNVEYECQAIVADLNKMYDNVEQLTTFLLSDMDSLSAIHYLSKPLEEQDEAVRKNDKNTLRTALYSYYVTQYYHRVSYINPNGTMVTSVHNNDTPDTEEVKIRLAEYYPEELEESLTFLGTYGDVWEDEESTQVVGLLKKIYGEDKGFFEIQIDLETFEQIFLREFPFPTKILAILDGKEVYRTFSSEEEESLQYEEEVQLKKGNIVVSQSYNVRGEELMIYCMVSVSDIIAKLWGVYLGILCFMAVLIFMTLLFLHFYLGKLVVPINALKQQMENTSFDNLPELVPPSESETELEELAALHKGYYRLIQRIRDGRDREQKLMQIQMQTQFDALQAQVNPHFINNTLNVISYRGMLLGDEEICEVCTHLSAMLKFSAGTKRRIVTIREELAYVQSYMELLKYRYREQFQYEILVDSRIYDQRLPKIVIQQLVENSVCHGYRMRSRTIRIRIRGGIENGWWYICVEDNGDGFEKEVLDNLQEEKARVREKILEKHECQEMEIGGMGLLNIYARLLLIHRQEFDMNLHNEAGAVVTIRSVMNGEETS